MKRFLGMLAIFALGAVIYVAAAPAGRQTSPTARQFAALKKQVAGLSAKVKTLQSQVGNQASTISTLQTTVTNDDGFINDCLVAGGAAPVSEFGDGAAGTYGYSYSNDGSTYQLTTALDLDGSTTPEGYFQVIDPSCVSSGSVHKQGVPSERRQLLTGARAR